MCGRCHDAEVVTGVLTPKWRMGVGRWCGEVTECGGRGGGGWEEWG